MSFLDKYVTEAKKEDISQKGKIVLSDNYYALVEAINRLADVLQVR
jgi:hypothetical protein